MNKQFCNLQTLAEHCDYNDEKDNQMRDRTLTFVADKQLKARLYRDNDLTLSKLLEIASGYHDKEALVLIPITLSITLQPHCKIVDQRNFRVSATDATKWDTNL